MTNFSKDDLVHQDIATLKPVDNHKKEKKVKSAIKPFNLDMNKLTGLSNFTEISKEPLALPAYAKQESVTRQPESDANKDRSHADVKAKRPDDKRKISQDKKPHILDSKQVS